MNVRIPAENLTGVALPHTNKAEETPRSEGASAKSGAGLQGGDRVEISSLSATIASASSAQEARQASRVQHLASLYGSGRYHVDSLQVSRAIVSQALNAGPAEMEK